MTARAQRIPETNNLHQRVIQAQHSKELPVSQNKAKIIVLLMEGDSRGEEKKANTVGKELNQG